MFYGNESKAKPRFYNKTALGEKIESIKVTFNNGGQLSSGSKIYCTFGNSEMADQVTTGEMINQAAGLVHTFTPTSDSTFFNITVTNKNAQFLEIVITYASGATASL